MCQALCFPGEHQTHTPALTEPAVRAELAERRGKRRLCQQRGGAGGAGATLEGRPRRASPGPSQLCVNITGFLAESQPSRQHFLRASRSLAAARTSAALQE